MGEILYFAPWAVVGLLIAIVLFGRPPHDKSDH